MKRSFLLFASLFAAASAVAAAENLVLNGGFENDANQDGRADHWFVHPSNQQAVEGGSARRVTDPSAPEGECFLRVSKTGGDKPHVVSNLVPAPRIEALRETRDAPLRLRAKIRPAGISGTANAAFQIFAMKPDGTGGRFVATIAPRPGVSGGQGWKEVEARVRLGDLLQPGEILQRIEIVLSLASNTGHADFDEISLTVTDGA